MSPSMQRLRELQDHAPKKLMKLAALEFYLLLHKTGCATFRNSPCDCGHDDARTELIQLINQNNVAIQLSAQEIMKVSLMRIALEAIQGVCKDPSNRGSRTMRQNCAFLDMMHKIITDTITMVEEVGK